MRLKVLFELLYRYINIKVPLSTTNIIASLPIKHINCNFNNYLINNANY